METWIITQGQGAEERFYQIDQGINKESAHNAG